MGLQISYDHFSEEFQWGKKKVVWTKITKVAILWKIKKYLRYHKHLFVFGRKDLCVSLEFCSVSILVRSSVNWAGLMVLSTVVTFNHLCSRRCLVKSWAASGRKTSSLPWSAIFTPNTAGTICCGACWVLGLGLSVSVTKSGWLWF